MKLTLTAPPSREPVLLPEVRDFLKIDGTEEDTLLTTLIRTVRLACENRINRKLIAQSWQWTLNRWAVGDMFLPLSPLISVDLVEVHDGTEFQTISASDYLLDRTSHKPRLVAAEGAAFSAPDIGREGIRITMTAGYGDDWNSVPQDIRFGLLHGISALYEGGDMAVAEKFWQPYRMVQL